MRDRKQHKQSPHHRLTFKDVIQDYQAGLLTAKGAVFYAVAASRRLGEPVQINPDQFSKQLGIHKATLYKAISLLKIQKRLDWSVQGRISLWVPTRETSENTRVPEYFFLDELSPFGDSQSPIGDNLEPGNQTPQDVQPPFLSLLSIQSLSISSGFSERELIEFENWLRRRAENLPRMPALIDEWIVKQANKPGVQNEFRRYLKGLQSRPEVAPDFYTPEKKTEAGERASRLAVLRRWWSQGKRDSVLEWLSAHPEQGITLSEIES